MRVRVRSSDGYEASLSSWGACRNSEAKPLKQELTFLDMFKWTVLLLCLKATSVCNKWKGCHS